MQTVFPERKPVNWLRLSDIVQQRRRGRSSIYRDILEGVFVPPVKLSSNTSAWPAHEIAAIDEARLAGATDGDIRLLVSAMVRARKAAA